MSNFTNFFDQARNGLSSLAGPAMGAVRTLAPMAGSAIGGMMGGPTGAMIGNTFGSMASNMLPQQYQGSTLGQLGNAASNYVGNTANNMLPQGMQGLGLGNQLSSFLNNQISSRLPSSYANQNLSGAGGMAVNDMSKRYGYAEGGSIEPQPPHTVEPVPYYNGGGYVYGATYPEDNGYGNY